MHLLRPHSLTSKRWSRTALSAVLGLSLCTAAVVGKPTPAFADASVTIPNSILPPPGVVADGTPTTPTVSASRAPIERDDQGRWMVPFARASLAPRYELAPDTDVTELDIPIPAGLRLVELRGVFDPRDAGAGATLKVASPEKTTNVDAPNGSAASFAIPFRQSITAAAAAATTLPVTLELLVGEVLDFQGNNCPVLITNDAVLSDLVLVYAGTPTAPTNIAEFLPPVLDRVTIETDELVEGDVAQAALRLTSTLVARYPSQSVQVDVITADEDEASVFDPFSRTIRLFHGPTNSARLIDNGRVLELTGSPSGLSSAVAFVGSPALATAFTTDVLLTETPLKEKAPSEAKPVTIDQLRRKLNASGAKRARFNFTARQSDLGGPTYRINLRMKGRVVSLNGDARKVAVRLNANGQPLATKEVAIGDGFVLEGSIEPEAIERDNEVIVEADVIESETAVSTNGCPIRIAIRLELDPDSVLTTEPGRAVPAGFDRFPAAFHDGFDVALSPMEVEQLSAAVRIVASLQERTTALLEPTVVAWPRREVTRPALLVGGSLEQLKPLRPPLLPGSLGVDAESIEVETATKPQPVTALQAFESTDKAKTDTLLLATADDSTKLISLADQVRVMSEGWNQLTGDVFLVSGGQSRLIRLREAVRTPVPLPGGGAVKPVKPPTPRLALQTGVLMALLGLGAWVCIGAITRKMRKR